MFLSPVSLNPGYKLDTPHQKQDGGFKVFRHLKDEVNRLDNQAVQTGLDILSPVPTIRRVNSLPGELEDKNYSRAAGVAALAAMNIPADWRELKLAIKNPFVYEGQHASKLAKGTFLNPFIKKNNWLNNFFSKFDITAYNTGFGKFIREKFNIKIDPKSLKRGSSGEMPKVKFMGNSLQKLAGRTLYRIPVLGLAASSLFEIPALIESTQIEGSLWDKTKSFCKQLCKSASHITLVNGAIAIGGAMLVPFGFLPALFGMAIGSAIGLSASQVVRKGLDSIIS